MEVEDGCCGWGQQRVAEELMRCGGWQMVWAETGATDFGIGAFRTGNGGIYQ